MRPAGAQPHGAEVVRGVGDPLAVDVVHPDTRSTMSASSSVVRASIARARAARGSATRSWPDATCWGRPGMTKGGEPLRSPPFRWVVRSAWAAP